jgi:hypothetical protein
VSASVGGNHGLFLTANGKVYGSGLAYQGRLGLNDSTISSTTNYGTLIPMIDGFNVLAGKTVTMVHAGNQISVLLTSDGKVYTCGTNIFGGLGVANINAQHDSPKPINDTNGVLVGKSVITMAVRGDTVLLVTSDGSVRGFGFNTNYELADGTTFDRYNPVAVAPNVFSNRFIVQVALGTSHFLALQNNGTVLSWGTLAHLGRSGTANIPDVIEDPNGNLTSRRVVNIAAGYGFSILITDDGRGFSFGPFNGNGQLCTGDVFTYTRVQPFAANSLFFVKAQAGDANTLLLTNDGKVYACGRASQGTLGLNRTTPDALVPTELTTLVGFFGGKASNIALTTGLNSAFVVMNATDATAAPTTTRSPTVTPTTTASPTTSRFSVTRKVALTTTITGDSSKIPQATSSDTFVLYASGDGTAKSQIIGTPESYTVASKVFSAMFTFNIASVSTAISMEIVSSDGKKVSVTASASTVTVDISAFFTSTARRENQVIIGGKPITFTMNVLTPNIAANVAKTSATVTLTVDKPSVGGACSAKVSWVLFALLFLIVAHP